MSLPKLENNTHDVKKQLQGQCEKIIHSAPLKPTWTVVAYGGGGTHGYHYERDRSQLTLRERARIETFSDDYCFFGGTSAIRAQIGEAVPPLMGKRIAQALRELLDALT